MNARRPASEIEPRFPLSAALASKSALAVLRVLSQSADGVSVRSLAAQAGISHPACLSIVQNLLRFRLADAWDVGKCRIVRLNDDHAVLREILLPALDRERQMLSEIETGLERDFVSTCYKLKLCAVACGRGRVDILAIPGKIEEARAAAEAARAGLEERYGFDVEFRVFTFENAPLELLEPLGL